MSLGYESSIKKTDPWMVHVKTHSVFHYQYRRVSCQVVTMSFQTGVGNITTYLKSTFAILDFIRKVHTACDLPGAIVCGTSRDQPRIN
jgi:hypothetical protein